MSSVTHFNSEPPRPRRKRAADRVTPEDADPRFDWWALGDAVLKRWHWLVFAGCVLAGLGWWAGTTLWKTGYTATAQLVRHDSPNVNEIGGDRQISAQTFAAMLRSPELLERVARQAKPSLSARKLATSLRVTPERNSEVMAVSISGGDPKAAVDLANAYALEAVQFLQQRQAESAVEVKQFLAQQLAHVQADVVALNQRLRNLPPPAPPPPPSLRLDPLQEKLRSAQEDLDTALLEFTEAHPRVQVLQAKVAALTNQLAARTALSSNAALADAVPLDAKLSNELAILVAQLQPLEAARLALASRQRAAESFVKEPPGYYQLLTAATIGDVVKQRREIKVGFLAAFAGFIGILAAGLGVLFMEILDSRLKTAADVRRVARLPVLAKAGDLHRLSQAEQQNWAFRTWTALQGRLGVALNRGMVCGIVSSSRGEGRSTWVNLLARAAHQRGFRVLTIATRPSPTPANNGERKSLRDGPAQKSLLASTSDSEPYAKIACPNCGLHIEYPAETKETSFNCPDCGGVVFIPEHKMVVAKDENVLAEPSEVVEKLTEPDGRPMVHIPLPGWVWNLHRRKQWQAAIQRWASIENLVILVELPPASVPEAVLLAEPLPNLIWLADTEKAEAGQTRAQLETLRHARCNLVGAVLNRSPDRSLRDRFPRWVGCVALLCALNATTLHAQETPPATTAAPTTQTNQPADTNLSFSALAQARRGAWQQKLTLGAGDVLNLSLYGQPELTRTDVPIGPDGRINYLEAQDVVAAGLTVDELRARLDQELGKYRRAPRSIITPSAYRSKKFFILGRVAQRGAYTLDRPMTIIEAVAHAQGLETSLAERNTVEVADFSRSFIARGGRRMAVDFQKLFQQGDLSQNIALEPGDYIYFPAGRVAEVYVLGEVRTPGPATYRAEAGALAAIAARGGFTERAWKGRVLVVRGSLNQPEAFKVDAADVLKGRAPDFALQPKDIIYVSARPWIKVEEVLDAAASAFIEAAIITWTGDKIRLID